MSDTFPLQDNMAMAFGTPVVAYRWPDSESLNSTLQALILEKEQTSAGIDRSNAGAWHSRIDLFDWDADCVRTLKSRVEKAAAGLTQAVTVSPPDQPRVFRYHCEGWANITRHGGYNKLHNHPNSQWSGVYYVTAGEPDRAWEDNGKLELIDPRTGINMVVLKDSLIDGRYIVEPIPGLMVIFPSWLKHLVHPFYGTGDRISIAFNVIVTEDA